MSLLFRDILTALALLSRLPIRGANFERSANAAWAWPLVGVVVGTLAVVGGAGAMTAGLSPILAAGLTLVISVIITGAMHEDGLADTADGFWGGWDPERRLAIMRDSQIGTYGVLALIISVGLRWLGIATLFTFEMHAFVLASAILSRTAMAPMAHRLVHARDDGLSVATGRPGGLATLMALMIGLGCAIVLTRSDILPALVAICLLGLLIGYVAHEKIGGQTGDVLGATQQVTEIGALIAFATLAQ